LVLRRLVPARFNPTSTMQFIASFVLGASIAVCSGLRHNAPTAVVSLANSQCDFNSSATGAVSLELSEDTPLLASDSPLAAWGAGHAKADDKSAFQVAIQDYKAQKAKFQMAEGRLMNAMEKLLTVPSVDGSDLDVLLKGRREDTLVVMYAPWCPHCQTFVLHDKRGDPTNAPLEVLYKKIKDSKMTANVVRFDVQKNGADIEAGKVPADFQVQGIPAVFFVGGDAMKVTKFAGNPHDSDKLFAFLVASMK